MWQIKNKKYKKEKDGQWDKNKLRGIDIEELKSKFCKSLSISLYIS